MSPNADMKSAIGDLLQVMASLARREGYGWQGADNQHGPTLLQHHIRLELPAKIRRCDVKGKRAVQTNTVDLH